MPPSSWHSIQATRFPCALVGLRLLYGASGCICVWRQLLYVDLLDPVIWGLLASTAPVLRFTCKGKLGSSPRFSMRSNMLHGIASCPRDIGGPCMPPSREGQRNLGGIVVRISRHSFSVT